MQATLASDKSGGLPKVDRRWSALARLLWLALLALGMFLVARFIPVQLDQLSGAAGDQASTFLRFYSLSTREIELLQGIGLSPRLYAYYLLGLETAWMLFFISPAILLLVRQPSDRMALFVSFALLMEGIYTTPLMFLTAAFDPVWQVPVSIFGGLGLAFLITMLYLFPDGRFVPRWTRYLAVLVFLFGPALTNWAVRNAADPVNIIFSIMILPIFFFMATGLAAQVYRYRRVSTSLQRQQTKWVVFSMMLMATGIFSIVFSVVIFYGYILSGWGRLIFLMLNLPVNVFAVALIPLSITFAMLRYRLWDIDLIIRRTLAYSFLTAALGLVTVSSILVLQRLVDEFLGGGSPLVTVVSTLAVVALLARLRLPIQDFIDRRFYRQKYNAEKVLAEFGMRQKNEVDLEALTADLINVIHATVQPASASLWLISTSNTPSKK